MITIDKETLKRLYLDEKLSQTKIADMLNCSIDIVGRFIAKYNLRKIKAMPTKEDLYDMYVVKNMKQRDIGKIYGVDHKTIYNYLQKYGIERDHKKAVSTSIKTRSKKIDSISYETAYDLYITKNLSRHDMANELDICVNLVDDLLRKHNIVKSKELIAEQKKKTNVAHFGETAYTKTKAYRDTVKKAYIKQYISNGMPPELLKIYADDVMFSEYIKTKCANKTIRDIATEFNLGYSTVAIRLDKLNLQKYINYNITSYGEHELLEFLIANNVEYEEHNRDILDGKEIDIYIPKFKIGIEFNGSYWHSELFKDRLYHQNKSKLAEEKGIFIYHIFDYEWIDKKDKILSQLSNLLQLNSNKIYARNCVVQTVSVKDKTKFLNDHHIQGACPSSHNIGLYYNDELVSLMTFGKSRFKENNENTWELIRFCSASHTTVIGAASKLFAYFKNTYMKDNESCVSYSDFSKTKGSLYSTLNFKFDHLSSPSYVWWYDDNKYLTRYQTQLKKEREKMQAHGYVRIYDCGTKVWIFSK